MKKRKIIIKFLLKFFITYFLLLGIYSIYLKQTQQRGDVFACSPITETVANQVVWLGKLFGVKTYTVQHESQLRMKFYIGHDYASNIVEGCTSVSVIILF